MQHFRLMSGRVGIALVASYMLVLQALLGAFALGSASAAPMLDAFGNPLCITSSDSAGTGSDRIDHSAMPDCCTVACGMFSMAAPADQAPHSLFNPLPASAARIQAAFDAVVSVFALERSPGSPRSPPLIV